MELALLFAGGLLVLTRFLGTANQRVDAYRQRVRAKWQEWAKEREAEFEATGKGVSSVHQLRVVVWRKGIKVNLETTIPADSQVGGKTLAWADFAGAAGPKFTLVFPPNERAPAKLGQLSVEARGPDPLLTNEILSEETRAKIRKFPRSLLLTSKGKRLSLSWQPVELEGQVLDAAVTLVAELAGATIAGFEKLRKLEGARLIGGASQGETTAPRIRVQQQGEAVWLEPHLERLQQPPLTVPSDPQLGFETMVWARCRARVFCRAPLPDFEIWCRGGRFIDDLPRNVSAPEMEEELRALGDGLFRVDLVVADASGITSISEPERWLSCTFVGMPSARQAQAAIRILSTLSAGSLRQGAFR